MMKYFTILVMCLCALPTVGAQSTTVPEEPELPSATTIPEPVLNDAAGPPTVESASPDAASDIVVSPSASPGPVQPIELDIEYLEGEEYRGDFLDRSPAMKEYLDSIIDYVDKHGVESAVESTVEPIELTVAEAVAMALNQNARIFVAEADVQAAEARIPQARAQLFPQVTARATHTRTEMSEIRQGNSILNLLGGGLGSVFGGGIGGDPATSIIFGLASQIASQSLQKQQMAALLPDDDFETYALNVTQVIYSGGRIRSAIRAARFLAESQEWRQVATLNDLELETKEAFFNALLANALVGVAEESVLTFERNLSDAQSMFEVGMISSFEVLRAQTEVGTRRTDLVAALNAQRLAQANLRRLLFIPQDTPLELVPTVDWLPKELEIAQLVAHALDHRPEILALEKAVEAARQDIKIAKAEYKPSVAATADYAAIDGGGTQQPDGWRFNVGAEWKIAAGGARRHSVIERERQVDSLKYQLEELERLVELEVTQARIQIQDGMARIKSERGNVDLAREGLRVAELRFQEGVGTQAEILDAELALTSAETSLIEALNTYAVANATLERAIGKTWRPEGYQPAYPSELLPAPTNYPMMRLDIGDVNPATGRIVRGGPPLVPSANESE